MEPGPTLAAIVLAAGYSRRMVAFKPLLPFGPDTVIERVLAAVRGAGIATLRVVVGWQAERLLPVLERQGVPWVVNPAMETGMYGSIQTGVQSLPSGVSAFFLLPGDMPLVRAGTLRRLADEWKATPGRILYPCHRGRRGHPPLIPADLIPAILTERPPDGLRGLLARHADRMREVECQDPGVLRDLDTPEQYRATLRENVG
jgi:CTP:molybdopterin cytidylyltransferase MocA